MSIIAKTVLHDQITSPLFTKSEAIYLIETEDSNL